jgi:hypothetical protein
VCWEIWSGLMLLFALRRASQAMSCTVPSARAAPA